MAELARVEINSWLKFGQHATSVRVESLVGVFRGTENELAIRLGNQLLHGILGVSVDTFQGNGGGYLWWSFGTEKPNCLLEDSLSAG